MTITWEGKIEEDNTLKLQSPISTYDSIACAYCKKEIGMAVGDFYYVDDLACMDCWNKYEKKF